MFPPRRGNCYSFALNRVTMNHKLQPGERAQAFGDPSASCSALRALIAKDAALNSRKLYHASGNKACKKGYYKIASVLARGDDYHFYRQMGDVSLRRPQGVRTKNMARMLGVRPSQISLGGRGKRVLVKRTGLWAHKRGLSTGALLVDACGKVIRDPRRACRDYGNLDYNKFCDFWCVKARTRSHRGSPQKRG